MQIDWLEFSVFYPFNNKSLQGVNFLQHVIEELGFIDFEFEKVYNKFYDEFYTYEGIVSFSTGFKAVGREIKNKKGEICHVRDHVHVTFTSKGLNIFRQINQIDDKDIRQFIIDRFKGLEIKCSRIDIAKDTELHIVEELIKNLFHGNYSGFRSWNQTGNNKSGLTAYLGGRSSEKYVRVYEKDKESPNEGYIGDRVELVLKNKYATQALYSVQYSIEDIFNSVMSGYWVAGVIEKIISASAFILEKIKHKVSTIEEKMKYVLTTYKNTIESYRRRFGLKSLEEKISSVLGTDITLRYKKIVANEKIIESRAKNRFESECRQIVLNDLYHDLRNLGWIKA